MKKNFFLFSLALGAMLGAASCSSEDMPAAVENDGVSFHVNLPAELQSRAFGDGLAATHLEYAVYASGDAQATVLASGTAEFVNLKTTVDLTLPKGKKYDIIFWAQKEGAPFAFDKSTQTASVNYELMTGYSEDYDAFTWTEKNFSIETSGDKTIYLYRPLAQLNIGTAGYDYAKRMQLDVDQTKVTVKNVYSQMNLYNGTCNENSLCNASFPMADIPVDIDFPVQPEKYRYMSMVYVMVNSQKSIHDVDFKVADASFPTLSISNVPLQRNYKTNIYGELINGDISFNIEILPAFTDQFNVAY